MEYVTQLHPSDSGVTNRKTTLGTGEDIVQDIDSGLVIMAQLSIIVIYIWL